jgi:hypothetical protein
MSTVEATGLVVPAVIRGETVADELVSFGDRGGTASF